MKYEIISTILGQTRAGWKYSCKLLEQLHFYSAAGLRERLWIWDTKMPKEELEQLHSFLRIS